jgi:DNA repair protein RadA/Sms
MDLAIALAVASSASERPVPDDVVAFGEIGLAGEVRSVARAQARLAESKTMGFSRALVPESQADRTVECVGVRTLKDAIVALRLDEASGRARL